MKKLKIIIVVILIFILAIIGFFYARDKFFPNKYTNYINEYSAEYNLDPLLVKGVIRTESKYNPNIVSDKNAKGLMQITDSTGEWIASKIGMTNFTPSMLFNPKINIELGCWYLNYLKSEFPNEDDAIAAYNAGATNVRAWLSNPKYSSNGVDLTNIPFTQTANYVKRVNWYAKIYKTLY